MLVSNFLQHAPACRVRPRKVPVPKRTVGDHGHTVFLTPGDDCVFDGAFLKMIKNLIASKTALARDLPRFLQIRRIEVAHTPRSNFSSLLQLFKSRNRVL